MPDLLNDGDMVQVVTTGPVTISVSTTPAHDAKQGHFYVVSNSGSARLVFENVRAVTRLAVTLALPTSRCPAVLNVAARADGDSGSPAQRSAVHRVVCHHSRNEVEVFEAVVRLHFVDVVDYPAGRDRTVGLLPDPPMFKNALPVRQFKADISSAHDPAMAALGSLQRILVGVKA